MAVSTQAGYSSYDGLAYNALPYNYGFGYGYPESYSSYSSYPYGATPGINQYSSVDYAAVPYAVKSVGYAAAPAYGYGASVAHHVPSYGYGAHKVVSVPEAGYPYSYSSSNVYTVPKTYAVAHHGAEYKAITRGAVHTAPLPGHAVSQTSINVAPAPGTW